MTATRTRLLVGAAVAALLCVLGAAWASFVPTSSGPASCGTWISPTTSQVTYDGSYTPLRGRDVSGAYADTSFSSCPDALATRRGVALGLLGLGAGATVAAVVLRRRPHDDDAGTSP